jgi:hypothetical protein
MQYENLAEKESIARKKATFYNMLRPLLVVAGSCSAHSLLLTPRAGIVSMSDSVLGGHDILGGTGSVGFMGNGQSNEVASAKGKFVSTSYTGMNAPARDEFCFGQGKANVGASVGFVGNGDTVQGKAGASLTPSPSPDDFRFGSGPGMQGKTVGFVGNGEK